MKKQSKNQDKQEPDKQEPTTGKNAAKKKKK